MSTAEIEKNKATFRRFCEGLNTADVELIATTIDEFVEPDALIRTPLPIGLTGARALKEVFTRLDQAYPDLHITIEDVIAEEIFIGRMVNGRIAETWGVVDVLSQMQQLGVILPAQVASVNSGTEAPRWQ